MNLKEELEKRLKDAEKDLEYAQKRVAELQVLLMILNDTKKGNK